MWKKMKREKVAIFLGFTIVLFVFTLFGYDTDKHNQENYSTYLQDYSIPAAVNEVNTTDLFPFLSKDLSTVRKIVFNRVPKCASTMSRHLFSDISSNNNFEFIFVLSEAKKNFNLTSKRRLISKVKDIKRPWIFVQHFHMFDFTEFGEEMPVHINIIRDPLQRLISSYYFNRHNLHMPMPKKDFDMTFEECVSSRHHDCTNPPFIFQVIPYFCGSLLNCTKPSDWSLARAKQNVIRYYSTVGYMEELPKFYFVLEASMPQFFSGLQEAYKKRGQAFKKKHSTKIKVGEAVLSDASIQYMKKLLARDYDFYYFIKQRFHTTYSHYNSKVNMQQL